MMVLTKPVGHFFLPFLFPVYCVIEFNVIFEFMRGYKNTSYARLSWIFIPEIIYYVKKEGFYVKKNVKMFK